MLCLLPAFILAGWLALVQIIEYAPAAEAIPLPACMGQPPDAPFASAAAQAREQIQAMMAERRIPGLAVAVGIHGQLAWSEGFGYADLAAKAPACPQTQFRVASVSKLFTVAAMARLVEKGKLDLDTPIQTYVPAFPEKGHAITARQLASHRAGIRAYRDDEEPLQARHYSNVLESLEQFQEDPLDFVPETQSQYSQYGYVLLSAAIEGSAGQDFREVIREHVFEPLGMKSSVEDQGPVRAPRQTQFYDHETPYSRDGQVRPSPFVDLSGRLAGGGYLSTVEDLVRFGSAHIASLQPDFLKPETLDLLFQPRSRRALVGVGLGWMTVRDPRFRRVAFHFGAGSGATSVLALYPDQGVVVAIAANLGHARFPINRLLGVANPFLSGSTARIFIIGLVILAVAALKVGWRKKN